MNRGNHEARAQTSWMGFEQEGNNHLEGQVGVGLVGCRPLWWVVGGGGSGGGGGGSGGGGGGRLYLWDPQQ